MFIIKAFFIKEICLLQRKVGVGKFESILMGPIQLKCFKAGGMVALPIIPELSVN